MRIIEREPPRAQLAPAGGAPAPIVVLSEWRAAHPAHPPAAERSAPAAEREEPRAIWFALLAALLVFGPPAISSLVRHKATPAEAARESTQITFGD